MTGGDPDARAWAWALTGAGSAPGGALVVDARGHRCPVPTLRLRRALETASPGALLVLLADDPMARIDAPHFCASEGHEVLGVEAAEGSLRIRVRKRAQGSPPPPMRP